MVGETPTTLSPSDATLLITLCQQGKLYAIEKWIGQGKPLRVPPEFKCGPLAVAPERGFHSLIELLVRNDVGQQEKDSALRDAVSRRNLDLVELLIEHGAELSSVPFSHVLLSWDPSLIRYFLERGADFITGAPFTEAFTSKIRTALRPFLECKRNYPALEPDLQKQADAALRYFCDADNAKWVSLMLWAGANPRSLGPSAGDPDDPDYFTTAFRQAAYKGNVKILKMLKPQADSDNVSELLHHSAMFGRTDAVEFLLQLRPNLNDKPNGGSSALDGALWNLRHAHFSPFYGKRQRAVYEMRSRLNLVQKLVEHGALWRPDDASSLNSLRRALFECEPSVTTELLRIFRKHQACTEDTEKRLLNSQRMKLHLMPVASRLSRPKMILHQQSRRSPRLSRLHTPCYESTTGKFFMMRYGNSLCSSSRKSTGSPMSD